MTKKKTTARELAAPKKTVQIRPEIQGFADQITEKRTSLSMVCYETGIWAMNHNGLDKKETALLKSVCTKQQWSNINKIAHCAHKLPKSAPTNLVGLGNFITALDKGANATEAKQYATNKISAKELENKIAKRKGNALPHPELEKGYKPEPVKPEPVEGEGEGEGEGETGGKGPDARKNQPNYWDLLNQSLTGMRTAVEGLKAELSADDKNDALEVLALLTDLIDDANEATDQVKEAAK